MTKMIYRIEMINEKGRNEDNQYAYGIDELKTFIKECIPTGCRIARIVKTTKDGRGYDITERYMR